MPIKPGVEGKSDEVMNAMGAIWGTAAQNRFNAMYLGEDSRLSGDGEFTNKNEFYDVFDSDSADEYSGFEYDATNGLYSVTDVGNPYLIKKETIPETVTNAIPLFNHSASEYETTRLVNQDFETTSGWVLTPGSTITISYSSWQVHSGAQSLQFTQTTDTSTDAAIEQTGIDLTDVTTITFWQYWGFTGPQFKVYIDEELIGSSVLDGWNEWKFNSFIIPEHLRGTNKSVKFVASRVYSSAGSSALDDIRLITTRPSPSVISVSADGGLNWTVVENLEIARPTPGTELWWKIELNRTDLAVIDKITETAIKYNLY